MIAATGEIRGHLGGRNGESAVRKRGEGLTRDDGVPNRGWTGEIGVPNFVPTTKPYRVRPRVRVAHHASVIRTLERNSAL